jgi:hypothetical protein
MDWKAGEDRLAHYNKWLMDPKRPLGEPYPGYPGDRKTKRAAKVSTEPVALKPKKSRNTHTEDTKGYMMTKVTNLSRATDIVRANPDRAVAIATIVETLGVTRSNAYVYFTKAVKALGVEPVKGEKVAKTAKASKPARKINPITETTPAQAAKKVAEIDAVIAGLKASGATVASPFAGL